MLAHMDKGVPLDRFKVLVIPAGLPKISADQAASLHAFTAAGGVIIRAARDELGISVRAEAAAGGPRLSLQPRGYVLAQLTRKPDGRTVILHLLNYNHQVPAENVKVRLDLNGLVPDLSRWQVKVLSPDAAQPQFAGLFLHGCVSEFTLRRIEHYAAVLSRPVPDPRLIEGWDRPSARTAQFQSAAGGLGGRFRPGLVRSDPRGGQLKKSRRNRGALHGDLLGSNSKPREIALAFASKLPFLPAAFPGLQGPVKNTDAKRPGTHL